MIRVCQGHGGSGLLAVEVDPAHVSNYGVFDIADTDQEGVKKVVGMVEKPAAEEAPSNLVATGRYLLDRAIFDALRRIKPRQGRGASAYRRYCSPHLRGGTPSTSSCTTAFATI